VIFGELVTGMKSVSHTVICCFHDNQVDGRETVTAYWHVLIQLLVPKKSLRI
jgi:hypothetical protein